MSLRFARFLKAKAPLPFGMATGIAGARGTVVGATRFRNRFSSPWRLFGGARPEETFRTTSLLLALPLALLSVTYLALDDHEFKEPSTGFNFPKKLKGTSDQVLIGAGARSLELYGIDTVVVKTYALGLYVDPTAAMKYLKEFRSIPMEQVNSAQYVVAREEMFHQLLRGKFDVTLRFIPTRDVAGDHLFSSFYKNLKKRYSELGLPEPEKDLKLMEGAFPTKAKIPAGRPVDFTMTSEGQLWIVIGSKVEGVIKNKQLAKAFFEIFLLEKTKTPAARREFAKGLVAFALSRSEVD